MGLTGSKGLFRLSGDMGQRTALDRLHDYYRLLVAKGCLVTQPALNSGTFPIQIVNLQLHKIQKRILC